MKKKRNPLKDRTFDKIGLRIKLEIIDESDNIIFRAVKPEKKMKSFLNEVFNLKL